MAVMSSPAFTAPVMVNVATAVCASTGTLIVSKSVVPLVGRPSTWRSSTPPSNGLGIGRMPPSPSRNSPVIRTRSVPLGSSVIR
jgi:hypothetical protein